MYAHTHIHTTTNATTATNTTTATTNTTRGRGTERRGAQTLCAYIVMRMFELWHTGEDVLCSEEAAEYGCCRDAGTKAEEKKRDTEACLAGAEPACEAL